MSQRRLGGVKAGGGRHRQRQRPAGPVLHPTPERGEDDGTHAYIRYNKVRVPLDAMLGQPGEGDVK